MIKNFLLKPICRFFLPPLLSCIGRLVGLHHKKDIFIVCERWKEARDNGYFLFKYLRKTYPNLPIYYIFDASQKNLDYQKIAPLGNIIQFASLRMFVYLYFSRYIASPHADIMFLCSNWLGKKVWQKKHTCFLQHGVIKDKMGHYYKNDIAQFNIIISGAKPEYIFLQQESLNLKITPVYTGLARWDRLHKAEARRTILVMPTWRRNLILPADGAATGLFQRISHLKTTDYYQNWQSFINHPDLNKILAETETNIVFYAHPNLYNVLGNTIFSSQNPKITIANPVIDYLPSIIEDSAMLVTDFSSIFWDFAYMGRPVIYYQFDEAEFRSSQWQEGYFSYKRDGFGPVFDSINDVVHKIQFYIKNNFKMERQYQEKAASHFILYDNQNCQRNYDAILQLARGENHAAP